MAKPPSSTKILVAVPASFSLPQTMSSTLNRKAVVDIPAISIKVYAPSYTLSVINALSGVAFDNVRRAALVSSTSMVNSGDLSSFLFNLYSKRVSVVS